MTWSNAAVDRPVHEDDKYIVLPFYLLVDVSGSMTPHMSALNEAMVDFRDSLAKEPTLADKVQFGVTDFSDDARCVVPLGDLRKAQFGETPLASRGGTSYGAAFRAIKQTIDSDFAAASNSSYRFFRPAVFFLTDGAPTDSWENDWQMLSEYDEFSDSGNKRYPLFVPFGIGDAQASILQRLVHPRERSALFMAKSGHTVGEAITQMLSAMLYSVMSSGRSARAGQPQHVVPLQKDLGPAVTAYPGGDFPG